MTLLSSQSPPVWLWPPSSQQRVCTNTRILHARAHTPRAYSVSVTSGMREEAMWLCACVCVCAWERDIIGVHVVIYLCNVLHLRLTAACAHVQGGNTSINHSRMPNFNIQTSLSVLYPYMQIPFQSVCKAITTSCVSRTPPIYLNMTNYEYNAIFVWLSSYL